MIKPKPCRLCSRSFCRGCFCEGCLEMMCEAQSPSACKISKPNRRTRVVDLPKVDPSLMILDLTHVSLPASMDTLPTLAPEAGLNPLNIEIGNFSADGLPKARE